ncbi:unnamed protein product [Schistosoma margrebowiei]|uniref:Uncharacterized protein n=1 Tax=Schistosoma margrebowiei TaxID=48269 RepID=A0A183MSP9_9TREM|nr:unnamed protein product [Schistosoma margrebowiei]
MTVSSYCGTPQANRIYDHASPDSNLGFIGFVQERLTSRPLSRPVFNPQNRAIHPPMYSLDDETKRANDLERSLIESRSQLVEFNTILRQLEDKIRHLEQKLNDAFLRSESDRYIKDKQTGKNDLLLKENLTLSNELEKLRKLAEEVCYIHLQMII